MKSGENNMLQRINSPAQQGKMSIPEMKIQTYCSHLHNLAFALHKKYVDTHCAMRSQHHNKVHSYCADL